ncbi:hypothetical protein E4U33_003003 [Claviceps sp. LM78 group G4]|nr:hypothetical protein E4U33_003001 [Claviceps sp. LM78 group G4]KAG6084688.1 hypothetical protein E4U33_003003 [Claviceps sp. LM78 group G4]
MSSSSTSSSPRPSCATQPSCAQLDASYSPARLASRNTSEDEDSDSSVSRLPHQEANDSDTDVNIDDDGVEVGQLSLALCQAQVHAVIQQAIQEGLAATEQRSVQSEAVREQQAAQLADLNTAFQQLHGAQSAL